MSNRHETHYERTALTHINRRTHRSQHNCWVRITPNNSQRSDWQHRRIEQSSPHQQHMYDIGLNGQLVHDRRGKVITLANNHRVVEFMSCSYLGLECDSRLHDAAKLAVDHYGVQLAAARTRIQPAICKELEANLTTIFKAPTTIFSTVGLTHLAMFPILGSGALPSYPICSQGPLWILDKTSHASIQILRGLLEQNGEVLRISFQDHEALESAFRTAFQSNRTPISISDGIGSMGGDAPVEMLLSLADRYAGYAYLDDAHGTSIMGAHGGGFVLQSLANTFHPRLLLVSSLSKAFGATGGAISLASPSDIEMIQRFSTPYIFGGPVSLPGTAAALASSHIHLSQEISSLQTQLQDNIETFDALAHGEVINVGQHIPIRGFVVGDEMTCARRGKQLLEHGFATTAALYPTVPKGHAMLRVALSALHSAQDIRGLINCYNSLS